MLRQEDMLPAAKSSRSPLWAVTAMGRGQRPTNGLFRIAFSAWSQLV